jgi:hypothetical protein
MPDKADKLAANTCFDKNLEPVDNPDGNRMPTIKIKGSEPEK